MTHDLVSILTPFKNTATYIAACLDSIIAQEYDNWELLIVDDHSTDHSFEIVNAYAEKDNRIKLFKNKGQGIIDGLRLAFSESCGQYITRMDSDDMMHPQKLQKMVHDLKTYGKQHIALGLVNYFSAEGIGAGYAAYETWLNNLTRTGENYYEIYKECVIPSPCWMVHRDDFLACDAFLPNQYPEDYDLTFRFYKYNMICIPSRSILHYWRDHNYRASRTHVHYAENHFLELKINYFLKLNYDSSRTLTIWGAGQKGKKIAKILQQNLVPFIWVCDNPKKIGKHIYDELLYSFEYLRDLKNPQCIVAVANENAQKDIKAFFKSQAMVTMKDYFFFC